MIVLGVTLVGCAKEQSADSPAATAVTLEEAVQQAILQQGSSYLTGEVATEGHEILEIVEDDASTTVYAIASFGFFAFENGIFTKISGSGDIPTVLVFSRDESDVYQLLEYQEPEDGSNYETSIKEMFPQHLWGRVLSSAGSASDLLAQQEAQARAYLDLIGRQGEVQGDYVEKQLLEIDVEASNKLFAEYGKEDAFLNNCPYWIGTRETIEDGQRYIYATSQKKDQEGYDLVIYKKTDDSGKVVEERTYQIVGSGVRLL
jgi:hypothetical protein